MTTPDFLTRLIKNKNEYSLADVDKKTIQREGIKKFIYNILNSSKYRAQATSEDYLKKMVDKINLCVNCQVPIHLTLPFGATKNPYLPSAPGIDWAEVFNIAYLREYLSPIAKAYKYGVVLEYVSVGVFEERVNRIPQKDVTLYDRQFTKLLNFYQKYLPKNFKLTYSRVTDKVPAKEAIRRIDLKIIDLRKNWNDQPQEVRGRKLFRAQRNCIYDPRAKNLQTILLNSALGHDAFCSECWSTENAPWDEKDMITLGHNYTTGWAIHVRSTRGSSVNFWSGVGLVIKRGDKYIPTVLSPKQFEVSKSRIKSEKTEIFTKVFPKLSILPVLYE